MTLDEGPLFGLPPESEAELPVWAAAAIQRLSFFARSDRSSRARELLVIRSRLASSCAAAAPNRGQVLQRFLHACLDLLSEAAVTREDPLHMRDELEALCDLARIALDGDCDDRPVIARASELEHVPGAQGLAVRIPGRVVWLGAMAAHVPDQEGAAAVMLVNDLAAVDPDLPWLALEQALRFKD